MSRLLGFMARLKEADGARLRLGGAMTVLGEVDDAEKPCAFGFPNRTWDKRWTNACGLCPFGLTDVTTQNTEAVSFVI